ncbi:MAG: hypothetical protein ACYSYL_00095 [Planctomycetota bacterium]
MRLGPVLLAAVLRQQAPHLNGSSDVPDPNDHIGGHGGVHRVDL